MGNFRTNDRGGFRGRSGGSRFGGGGFGGRDSGRFERRPLEMHDATCDKCKKQCQVPFRPSGDKPVLCSDCFRNEGPRDRGRPFSPRASSSGMSSEQFTKINAKLDKIIQILDNLEVETEEDLDDNEEKEDLEVDLSEDSSKDSGADSDKDKNSKDDSDDDLDDDLDDDEDDDSEDEPKTA
jgi:CxxC-x17-CxxC domain-containing protein